jgi:hypothetical protein
MLYCFSRSRLVDSFLLMFAVLTDVSPVNGSYLRPAFWSQNIPTLTSRTKAGLPGSKILICVSSASVAASAHSSGAWLLALVINGSILGCIVFLLYKSSC